ncbi:hypothetical protein [Streptomyces sp. NPDC058757]|uniref:hypothetical protein n=1 Tax=unclassified Streptomyces TaxID=2593676 RepID=UPI0036768B26
MLRTRIAETVAVAFAAVAFAVVGTTALTVAPAEADVAVAVAPLADPTPGAGTDNMTWQ